MAILNQKKILNLIPKISAPVTIHVSQGDVGTQIEFTLVKGDEVFSNTGNLTASVHGVREDGANFGPFTCTLSGSKVTFPLHSEMTAVKGSAIAEIVLVDNDSNKVGSANFGILVEESVFPLRVTYDNDVSVYESILTYVQTIPAQLTDDYTSKINMVQSGLNNEISTRTSQDALINTRIDEIIAPSGEAPNPAEITDARIGANGVIYDALGNAIRNQITSSNSDLHTNSSLDSMADIFTKAVLVQGNIDNNGADAPSTSRVRSDYLYVGSIAKIHIDGNSTHQLRLFYYNESKIFVGASVWISTTGFEYSPIENNIAYVRFIVNSGDVNVDISDVVFTVITKIKEMDELIKKNQKYISILDEYSYESGGINYDYGFNVSSSKKIRTKAFINIKPNITVSCNTDYKFVVFVYDNNLNYLVYSSKIRAFSTDDAIALNDKAAFVKVVLEKNDGSNITTSALASSELIVSFLGEVVNDDCNISAQVVGANTATYIIRANHKTVGRNILISAKGKNITSNAKVSCLLKDGNGNTLYGSPEYILGTKDNYLEKTWRLSPFPDIDYYYQIAIAIPASGTLDIEYLNISFDNSISRETSGTILMAHNMVGGCPPNTLAAFTMAAKMGYKYVITIPKVTSDGVFVCIHDDSVMATGRNDDGTELDPSIYDNRTINQFTYAELQTIDFGVFVSSLYSGERIPTLQDFVTICAKTGMHPVLSIHPALSGNWNAIRTLMASYGVLDKLIIKSTYPIIDEIIVPVLGNDIEGYVFDQLSDSTDITENVNLVVERHSLSRSKVAIEYLNTYVTDAMINNALAQGYKVSLYGSGKNISEVEAFMYKGVTIFTEDFNCSNGLNW